jgi:hypothetical protein
MKWLTNLDLNLNQLMNHLLHLLGSDPGSPTEGQQWYNTASHQPKIYNGTRKIILDDQYVTGVTAGDSTITMGGTALAPTVKVAKALDHTYTTDFDTQVRTSTLNQMTAPTADLSINSHKLTSVTDPTSAQDAATKNYVDAAAAGARDVKDSVRAATTGVGLAAYSRTGSVLTASANGALAAIDGVTLIAGDRLLVKDGAANADNGIYTVTQVGTGGTPWILTRATDADTSAEVTAGLFVFVEEGTSNGDSGWLLTTNNPITLNTTGLTFTQVSGLGQVTAGAGLTKTGNTLDVGAGTGITVNADDVQISASYPGQTSITTLGTITTGVWTGTAIAVANGGTGATTAAGARTNLGVPGRYATDVGTGSATAITVTHNLGTKDCVVAVYDNTTPFAVVVCDVEMTTTNTVTLRFAVAPTSSQYRCVVIG